MKTFLALLGLLLAGFAAPARAGTDPRWAGEIVLALRTAIPGQRELIVHLEHRDGQWTETWGEAFGYNVSMHAVKVTESSFIGDDLQLSLAVTYRRDFWIKQATGNYQVRVKRLPVTNPTRSDYTRLRSRLAQAAFEGEFRGQFTGHEKPPQEMAGAVVGFLLPWRQAPEGFVPVQPGEHPRLLVRQGAIPALRQRLDSPLGQAVVEELKQLGHEVAPAILFQLTGDKSYAQKAFAQIATGFKDEKGATHGYGGGESEHVADYPVGHQAATAVVYDLCQEAWTQGQREETRKWLRWMAEWAILKPWGYSNTGSTASPIGHSSITHAGGALMALALWGIKAPPPPEPTQSDDPLLKALGATLSPEQMAQLRAEWQTQMNLWKQAQGSDLKLYEQFLVARRAMSCLINEKIGEGGTVTSIIWQKIVLDSAIAHRSMFGTDWSARDELRNAAVLPLIQTIAWQPNLTHDQPVGPGGPLNIDPSVIARLLVLAPPQYRPAIEEYWLRMTRLTRAELATAAGAQAFVRRSFPSRAAGADDPWGLLYTLQYFGQTTGQDRAELPRTWDIAARGEYLFRAGTLEEPLLVTMDANLSSAMGPDLSGGSFALFAFGQGWTASMPIAGDTRARHNVVHVPGQRFNGRGRGRLLHQQADPETGNGGLSLDLSEFCREMLTRTVSVVETQRVGAMLVPRSTSREVTEIVDAGLRAQRAMAVDYSGRCGAPLLLVIADRFEGPRDKLWVLNTPELLAPARPDPRNPWVPPFRAQTATNSFELRKQEVSVRGLFVSPNPIQPRFVDHSVTAEHIHHTRAAGRGMLPFRRAGIEALVPASQGDTVDFLVIITAQKGPAPAIEATGSGLAAKIKVGNLPIHFDGQKIVIGQ